MSAPSHKFLGWLAVKASDYCRWYAEREVRGAPVCPDCEAPEPWCYCREKERQQAMCEGAFADGYERAMEERYR